MSKAAGELPGQSSRRRMRSTAPQVCPANLEIGCSERQNFVKGLISGLHDFHRNLLFDFKLDEGQSGLRIITQASDKR